MSTLREHLEAISERHSTIDGARREARAALAILETGVEMRRIGRAFYEDTDEGERVVVIPLDPESPA